jgi:hypothetical protein
MAINRVAAVDHTGHATTRMGSTGGTTCSEPKPVVAKAAARRAARSGLAVAGI